MNETILLQPKAVFDCFAEINRVPRPSKHEERMIAFLQDFGKSLGLETRTDEVGNVIICKPATPGCEGRPTVILQSHFDMVCEKNADVEHDFLTDPIQTEIDGEWMRAKGTTLGADDGIGVAMQMALLQATDVEHGPLECLFTRDEETGLTGAMGLQSGFMSGKYLINLDSEDEGQIFVSCAGGARTTAWFDIPTEELPDGFFTFSVKVSGLRGGHSGDDINKFRANANRLLVRFLTDEMERMDLRLCNIQSGGLHNAIPREGWAVCAVPTDHKEQVRIDLNHFIADLEEEIGKAEPDFKVELESCPAATSCLQPKAAHRMLLSLRAVCNGVYAMSFDMPGLVETSSNLASIRLTEGSVVVTTSQRSSVGSARLDISAAVRAAFTLGGARVETGEGYPGWKMNPDSHLLRVAVESYRRLFGKEPKVLAIHAGLECGLFSEKYPGLDMISVGPTLRGVHSPEERLLIPTVQLVWDHVLDILKNL